MRASMAGLTGVLSDGAFTAGQIADGLSFHLLVDVLHGTDRVARDLVPESWSLGWDLDAELNARGSFRFVHESVNGESWVPVGATGILSPFRATLLVSAMVQVGDASERVQLGLFDVVSVPFAEDTHVESSSGELRLITSTVEVEVRSLDARVQSAALRSPVTVDGDAVAAWRKHGLLPVAVASSASVPSTTFPAEAGSRLALVQTCARLLGGVPVVNSRGEWALTSDISDEVVVYAWGPQSTVTDLSSEVTTSGFFNVVVGDYENTDGSAIRAVWEAPGELSPAVLGREWVRFHSSPMVRTQQAADETVASVGAMSVQSEVDVVVTCIVNPFLELGDRVRVVGLADVFTGVAQRIDLGDELMRVTVRVVRSL